MTGQIILYALLAAAALSVAGLCLERLALMRGWSLRWVWVWVIAVSMGYPLVAILLAPRAVELTPMQTMDSPGTLATTVVEPPAQSGPATSESAGKRVAFVPAGGMGTTPTSGPAAAVAPVPAATLSQKLRAWLGELPVPADHTLFMVWAAATLALWCHLAMASLLLARRARTWPEVSLHGQRVLVSDSVGPALLGWVAPRIVVPRWFLDEPADTQALVVEHELQHLRQRDPLLLRVAQVAVAAAPWNLPLWWQLRRLRLAIELDCDARVLRTGATAHAYGEVLLSVTRRAGLVPAGVVAMAQRASSLELRIHRLVHAPAPRSRLQTAGFLVLALAMAAAAVALEAPTLPSSDQAPRPAAAAAPLVPGQPPYVMPDLSSQAFAASSMIGGPLQAALERYPELLTGRDAEGIYAVGLVLNADGSVHASDMRFTTRERVLLVDEEMSAAWPPDAINSRTTSFNKGMQLPGGGTLPNNVRVSTHTLPADFDPSRSLALVQNAVKAKHGDLMHDRSHGEIGVVTVLMTDDGRIARDHVERIKLLDMRVKLPPEAEASHFAVLGVQPAELGRIGMGFVTRRTGDTTPVPLGDGRDTLQPGGVQEILMVLYAWPRRAGDPPLPQTVQAQANGQPAGTTPAPGQFLPITRASAPTGPDSAGYTAQSRRVKDRALAALLETYPELMQDAGREGRYTAALTLRPDGSVYRSGLRVSADSAETTRHMQELRPVLYPTGTTVGGLLMKGELLPNGARLANQLHYQFKVLPQGLDEARTEQLVREAVLEQHADLLLPTSAGVTNLLTVMMTDDGRIARHTVQFGPTQEIMRSSGRPEDFDFAALDIRAEDIGVYGRLMLSQQDIPDNPTDLASMLRNRRQLMVRYAWPRRQGEPVGGYPTSPQGTPTPNAAVQRDQAAELAGRYFPDLLAAPAAQTDVRPWVLLSNQGDVVRTGRATLGPDEPFVAAVQLGRQMPGAQFAEVEFHRVPAAGGRQLNVAFVWLAAGSPAQ